MGVTRRWNTVAALAVVLTLWYFTLWTWEWWAGRATITVVDAALKPVLALILGYLARMLTERED